MSKSSLPLQGKVAFGENACVFAERRKRSFSREKARKSSIPQGESTSSDPLRGPPSPESLPSVAGEGFDNRVSRHSCSLFFGPAGPISLKSVHWTDFQALDVPVPFDLPLAIPLTSRQTRICMRLNSHEYTIIILCQAMRVYRGALQVIHHDNREKPFHPGNLLLASTAAFAG